MPNLSFAIKDLPHLSKTRTPEKVRTLSGVSIIRNYFKSPKNVSAIPIPTSSNDLRHEAAPASVGRLPQVASLDNIHLPHHTSFENIRIPSFQDIDRTPRSVQDLSFTPRNDTSILSRNDLSSREATRTTKRAGYIIKTPRHRVGKIVDAITQSLENIKEKRQLQKKNVIFENMARTQDFSKTQSHQRVSTEPEARVLTSATREDIIRYAKGTVRHIDFTTASRKLVSEQSSRSTVKVLTQAEEKKPVKTILKKSKLRIVKVDNNESGWIWTPRADRNINPGKGVKFSAETKEC